jgi:hypothetical protein
LSPNLIAEIPINLAYEDDLSLEILLQLLKCKDVESSEKHFSLGTLFHGRGSGYLKRNIQGFNRASTGMPYLVLTDLDKKECAPKLIQEWLPETINPNLIFRVAVREVESWVLADRSGFAKFLGITEDKMPKKPDELVDPKAHLIELARTSRKRGLRDDIVPKVRSTARQGPSYNECLVFFVRESWNPSQARQNSPSLERTLKALEGFNPLWNAKY